MLYEEMRVRKSGEIVRVYSINPQDNTAMVFSIKQYTSMNNGWTKTKLSQLVPVDFPLNNSDFTSKTQKNKAKDRMKLLDATWQTTDGTIWNHSDIEKAIEHELYLMNEEKEIKST